MRRLTYRLLMYMDTGKISRKRAPLYVNDIIKIPTLGGENSPLCYAGFKSFVILKA